MNWLLQKWLEFVKHKQIHRDLPHAFSSYPHLSSQWAGEGGKGSATRGRQARSHMWAHAMNLSFFVCVKNVWHPFSMTMRPYVSFYIVSNSTTTELGSGILQCHAIAVVTTQLMVLKPANDYNPNQCHKPNWAYGITCQEKSELFIAD